MSREMRLKAKVTAVNRVNEYAVRLFDQMRAIWLPHVGQKILKVDGGLLEKYNKLLPVLPRDNHRGIFVYRHTSDYSLAWTVKTNEPDSGDPSGSHTVLYHEATVYVGDLRGLTLEKVYDTFRGDARTDYTEAGVLALRADFEAKKKLFEDARSALYPFGEYDR